eukprot:5658584-Prymnesium_polylepis.1
MLACTPLLSPQPSLPCAQPKSRTKDDGTGRMVSNSTVDQQRTGKMYIQCILTELSLGDVWSWIKTATHGGEIVLERAIGDVFRHMLTKVQKQERWKIPEECCTSKDEKENGRVIRERHPKEMSFAFRSLINQVRQLPDFRTHAPELSTSLVPIGWLGGLNGGLYGT